MYNFIRLCYAMGALALAVPLFQTFGFLYGFFRDRSFRLRLLYQVDDPADYKMAQTSLLYRLSLIAQTVNLLLTAADLYPAGDEVIIVFPVPALIVFLLLTALFTYYLFFYIESRKKKFSHKMDLLFSQEDSLRAEEFLSAPSAPPPPSYSFSYYRLPAFMPAYHRTLAKEACAFLYEQIGSTLPSHEAFCAIVMQDFLYSLANDVGRNGSTAISQACYLLYLISLNRLTQMQKTDPPHFLRCHDLYSLLWNRAFSVLHVMAPSVYTSELMQDESRRIRRHLEIITYVPSWERNKPPVSEPVKP